MRHILVTGANKGIGFAIAKGILREHEDTHVFLGSRDPQRGRAAVEALTDEHAACQGRVEAVTLDVASDGSVAEAAASIRATLGPDGRLYGVVNNAGIGLGAYALADVLNVNVRGVQRVCEAFVPMLQGERGRVVNVTSAAGPNFVAECSEEKQAFFLNADTEWSQLDELMRECVEIAGDTEAFAARGLAKGEAYGLSKACANTYTLQLARRHPHLHVNACTPGFIETDLTRAYAASQGRDPQDLGMKTPDEGARCPLHLLFAALEGNGRYYGSDCLRSPLDRYRAPGTAAYAGD